MAEALLDDDETDSIDSVVRAYREEATADDSNEGDIINSTKKMRASGLSYEKVKVFSDGKCAEEKAVNYNNFKLTCCKINDTEQQGCHLFCFLKFFLPFFCRFCLLKIFLLFLILCFFVFLTNRFISKIFS